MSEGNGKWQLAFWIITIACGAWLLSITAGIVQNDRIRAEEDNRIETKMETYKDCMGLINERLARIETDIAYIKQRS